MVTHHLRCDSVPFRDVIVGLKTYEIRKDDRGGGYATGDRLLLHEQGYLAPGDMQLSGCVAECVVVHKLTGYGIEPGFCALGIRVQRVYWPTDEDRPRHPGLQP